MSNGDAEEKEQVQDTPEEEKVEEPSEPQDVDEAVKRFEEEKAKEEKEKPSDKTEEEPEKAPPGEKEGEEKKEEEKLEPSYWIVDKDGNKTPAVFKADGKEHYPDSVDKILTWGNFGIHRKTQDAEIEQARPFLELLQKRYEEGRLVLDGEPILPADIKAKLATTEEEKPEEEPEEEDEPLDPTTAKLKKEVDDLKKKDEERAKTDLKTMVKGEQVKIETEISTHKEKFFGLINRAEENSPKEVWDLLAQREGKKAKYTVEEATKISHESSIAFAKELIKNNPKEFEVDEDGIYARKLAEKKEREETSVSSPSETPAVVETKPEEEEFADPAAAARAFYKQHAKKVEQANKT